MHIVKIYVDQEHRDFCYIDFETHSLAATVPNLLNKIEPIITNQLGYWSALYPSYRYCVESLKNACTQVDTDPGQSVMRLGFTCADGLPNWIYIAWPKTKYYLT